MFNDGRITVFAFGGIYAAGTFGMTLGDVIKFGIAINIAAGLGALLFGFVDDRIGGKRTVLLSCAALAAATALAVWAPTRGWFWVAGMLIGVFAGPNQAASRSLMARFAPRDGENEFFGFYAFSGRLTSFAGPALLGVAAQAVAIQRAGVAMLKQAACAAEISFSGFVPFEPPKRVPKLKGPLKAPLSALKVPLPSLSFPSQAALALLVGIVSSLLLKVPRNRESGEAPVTSLRLGYSVTVTERNPMPPKKKKKAKKATTKAKLPARRQPETLRLRSIALALTATDLQRSIAFYRDVLGFMVGDEWRSKGVVDWVDVPPRARTFMLTHHSIH